MNCFIVDIDSLFSSFIIFVKSLAGNEDFIFFYVSLYNNVNCFWVLIYVGDFGYIILCFVYLVLVLIVVYFFI